MTESPHLAILVLTLGLALAPGSGQADTAKTDVVSLDNGDRITCAIKELKTGQIRVKTSALGTVYVELDKVTRITTVRTQEVGLSSGERLYGPLVDPSADRRLAVETTAGPREVALGDVIYLRPLRTQFLDRIDGSLDIGGSYTQANRLFQLTPSLSATYGSKAFSLGFDFSWLLTRQEGVRDSERLDTSLRYARFLKGRNLVFGQVTGQRNSELGLDWRTEAALGFGRFLVSTGRSTFVVSAGLAANRERPEDGASTTNIEGLFGADWHVFSYNFPKTDIMVSVVAYPGLSEWGRFRGEGDVSLKYELLHDFTVTFHVYDSFDNQPATDGASTNDWGATISLGWTF